MTNADQDFEDSGYFEPYKQFASQLRTWLVAYGIGAPVLFVSQATIADALKSSGRGKFVIVLFLLAVAAQILHAWIYKAAMWYQYLGELSEEFRKSRRYKVSRWISKQFWPDLLTDFLSVALLSLATYKALGAVIK